MAKTNIVFNNTTYSIDESSISAATAELRQHLSTVMNGSGAVINFGGTSYGIDSTKLATAKNAFVTHLGTIAGSGSKVIVGGVEYSVGSDKIAGAVGELEDALGSLNSGGSSSDKLQNVYWDGNTDGCDVLFDTCFKVSDKTFTKEDVIGATLVLTNKGKIKETLLTSDNVQQITDGFIIVMGQMGMDSGFMFISTSIDDGSAIGAEIPSKGTYFAKDSEGEYYISSLTFPA